MAMTKAPTQMFKSCSFLCSHEFLLILLEGFCRGKWELKLFTYFFRTHNESTTTPHSTPFSQLEAIYFQVVCLCIRGAKGEGKENLTNENALELNLLFTIACFRD